LQEAQNGDKKSIVDDFLTRSSKHTIWSRMCDWQPDWKTVVEPVVNS